MLKRVQHDGDIELLLIMDIQFILKGFVVKQVNDVLPYQKNEKDF